MTTISNADITVKMIDKLYIELKKILRSEKDGEIATITPENIITIALNLMQVVETYRELKGVEKKQLIINTLKKFIDDEMKGKDPEYRLLILSIVNTTLPIAIDAFISIDTKQIQIKITGYLKTCCF